MQLIADMWLFDMGLRDNRHQAVSRILMRTQILVYKRTGHLMQFGEDRIHDAILHQAKWGRVSRTPVSCLRCGIRALLTEWVSSVDLLDDARRFMLEGQQGAALLDLQYLAACTGEKMLEMAVDTLQLNLWRENG